MVLQQESVCRHEGVLQTPPVSWRPAASYLLPGDGHAVLDVPEHGGLDEVAPLCSRPAPTQQPGPLSPPAADVAQDLVKLLLVDLQTAPPALVR